MVEFPKSEMFEEMKRLKMKSMAEIEVKIRKKVDERRRR